MIKLGEKGSQVPASQISPTVATQDALMRIRMLSVNNSALKVKIILKNHVRTGFFRISMKKFVLNKISCYAKYDKLKILPPGIGFAFFMRIRLQEASYNADPCGFGSTLLHIGLGTVVTFSRWFPTWAFLGPAGVARGSQHPEMILENCTSSKRLCLLYITYILHGNLAALL